MTPKLAERVVNYISEHDPFGDQFCAHDLEQIEKAALAAADRVDEGWREIAEEALREICRGTDLRAGNGDSWAFGVASKALEKLKAISSRVEPPRSA